VAPPAAVVDTDVFSWLYIDPAAAVRRGRPVDEWLAALTGVRVLISFQTRAEVLAGVHSSGWGPRRAGKAVALVSAAPTIPADDEVIAAFASLTAVCRAAGHALQHKIHTADRWVAASAVAKDLPLLSGDGIFEGAPGLTLL
jgi:predicted nucleic acid-binding protein